MKKLKGFEEIVSDVESSQDETSRKGRRGTSKFMHCSQPVLGTPLKRKLHSILANWKPPAKKSQSTKEKSSCNVDEKENVNCSPHVGKVTDKNSTEVNTPSTDTPGSSVSDETGPLGCDIKTDQAPCPHVESELFQNTTPLPAEGSVSNENKKEKKGCGKLHEINYEDLKSKYLLDIQRKEESKNIQENLVLEKRNYESKGVVPDDVDVLPNETNEDGIRNPMRAVKEHHNDTFIEPQNIEKEVAEVSEVSSHSPRQLQSNILAKTNISSLEENGSKLTLQSKGNILGKSNHSQDLKLTSQSSQQFKNNNPSTCIPSFNDILSLDQDESTQEVEHEGCFVEKKNESHSGNKSIKESQSGKGKLTPNSVDCPTPNEVRVDGNQQLTDSVGKNTLTGSVVDDDLCISDSQFESIERNFIPKLSTPSTVPSQQSSRWTSSLTSSSYGTPFPLKMNQMQWVSQMKNDKRRLQGVVREISQLNAMLTRAIKEIWPTKK